MHVTKPYEFAGFGVMHVTKPYDFIGFGVMHVTKPYEFMRFGTMFPPPRERGGRGPKPVTFLRQRPSGATPGGGDGRRDRKTFRKGPSKVNFHKIWTQTI